MYKAIFEHFANCIQILYKVRIIIEIELFNDVFNIYTNFWLAYDISVWIPTYIIIIIILHNNQNIIVF